MTSRAVLVVGATSGIGLATALELAGKGNTLLLMARDDSSLASTAQSCMAAGAREVRTSAGDAGSRDDVQRAVELALDSFGRLDAVVHTATVMAYGRVEDVPHEVFRAAVSTAVNGTLHLAQLVIPLFRGQGGGTFVVVNSLVGSVTVPNMGAYATAKWAQRALVRTLQQELLREHGVHVCLVSPGSVNTPIYDQAANYLGRATRPPAPVLQPDRVGRVIAGLLDRPRKHVSVPVGPGNPLLITGYRLFPTLYDFMVEPLFRLLATERAPRQPTAGNVTTPHAAAGGMYGRWPTGGRGRRSWPRGLRRRDRPERSGDPG